MVSQHVSSHRGSCQPQMSIPLLTLLPPPETIAHMALEDCPPRTKEWGVSVEDEQPNIPVTMGRVAGRFN